MFGVFHWIWKFIEFFGGKIRTSIGIFILFCLYILFHFLMLWKKEEFKTAVCRLLRIFRTILIIYFVYSLVLILKKDFFISLSGDSAKIDVLLFPILCGFLALLILLLFNKVQIFIFNKFEIFLGIPLSILGVMIGFLVFYVVPLRYTEQGRHAPVELIVLMVFFLIFLSLFIGIKNIVKKINEK